MKPILLSEDELYVQFTPTYSDKNVINGICADIQYDNTQIVGIISIEAALDLRKQLNFLIKKLK